VASCWFTSAGVANTLVGVETTKRRRVTDRGFGYDMRVEHMESPAKAERKQARERQFLPPIWPLLAVVVVIVGIAVWLAH
jgi:hypothetical protein